MVKKSFLKLVSLGFTCVVPIAWYTMSEWLATYAYRIEISLDIFLIVGLAALFIAVATVCWQSLSAALMNPVENLRSE